MLIKLQNVEFDRPVHIPGTGEMTASFSRERQDHAEIGLELVDRHGHVWIRLTRKGVEQLSPVERVISLEEAGGEAKPKGK